MMGVSSLSGLVYILVDELYNSVLYFSTRKVLSVVKQSVLFDSRVV